MYGLGHAEKLLAVRGRRQLYMVSKPSFSALSAQGKERAICRRSRACAKLDGKRGGAHAQSKDRHSQSNDCKSQSQAKIASRGLRADRDRAGAARGRRQKPSQRRGRSRGSRPATFGDEDFHTGLRSYAAYRDLGISDATAGMVQAHVIRFIPPCRPEEVSKLHYPRSRLSDGLCAQGLDQEPNSTARAPS